jgi:hypothetical protein
MNRQDTIQCARVLRLLELVGCEKISVAFEKMHYWDFVVDIANYYAQNENISDKQYEAIVGLVHKHTDARCKPKGWELIVHEKQYDREGETTGGSRTTVEHNYGELHSIQLFDLPYENGELVGMIVHPYNSTHMVTHLNGVAYKIPKPDKWGELVDKTSIKCRYKRTACKGFLEKVAE